MTFAPKIRPLVLGLIRDPNNRIFVSQGYDRHKQETFYRPLGGGIEFGETSQVALQREFREELQVELANINYLGCLENIFNFNGKPGHEIIQLYSCDFVDPSFYQRDRITFNEDKQEQTALWINADRCLKGEIIVYPVGIAQYIGQIVNT